MRLPRHPTHPGQMLFEEFLKPLGMSQLAFARHLGVPYGRIHQIVKGRRSLSPETAWLFSHALGTSPLFWMNLQTAYDLVHHKAPRRVPRLIKAG